MSPRIPRSTAAVIFASLMAPLPAIAISAGAPHAATPRRAVPAQAGTSAAISQGSPETALRTFMLALFTRDSVTLHKVILPVPASYFQYLVAGQPISSVSQKRMHARIAAMTIKPLKAGDVIRLPDGRYLTLTSDSVGPNRAVLVPEGSPLPMVVVRQKGRWYVDALGIIAARKAAAEARRSKKTGTAGP